MKLHVLILTALIGLVASKTIEDCKNLCDNNSTEKSDYCEKGVGCYGPMVPQCYFNKLQCAIDVGHADVKLLYSLSENCLDKQPKCKKKIHL